MNSARDIAGVRLSAPDPGRHAEFLTKFTSADKQSLTDGGLRFVLDGSRIEVVSAAEAQTQSLPSPFLTSFSVRVDEIDTLARLLTMEGIPLTVSEEGIILAANSLCAVELRFETKAGM